MGKIPQKKESKELPPTKYKAESIRPIEGNQRENRLRASPPDEKQKVTIDNGDAFEIKRMLALSMILGSFLKSTAAALPLRLLGSCG